MNQSADLTDVAPAHDRQVAPFPILCLLPPFMVLKRLCVKVDGQFNEEHWSIRPVFHTLHCSNEGIVPGKHYLSRG